jgi:anti-sigma factor RsiW
MTMMALENWALHAYADGELDGSERADVERLLAQSPEARAELEAIKRQKQMIKSSFSDVADEPLPAALLRSTRSSPRRLWFSPATLAAAIALLAVGAGSGWMASKRANEMSGSTLAERALSAYEVYAVEVKHPVEVPASEQDHLQTWLSKRVGAPFKAPDLASEGYQLLGGRLLADGARPAGLLVYEDAQKRRMTIFVAANAQKDSSPVELDTKGKLVICYWRDADLVYAFVGEKTPEDMRRLATLAHDKFEG